MIKEEYKQWIVELKGKIRSSQAKAALSVNQELILLYWDLGKTIAQKENVWGSKLLENISFDLKSEFPNAGGFSVRNLKYCRQFYNYFSTSSQALSEFNLYKLPIRQQAVAQFQDVIYQDNTITSQLGDELLLQAVAVLPWGHITLIISNVKDVKHHCSFFAIS